MISRQIDLTINKMTKAQYNGISPVADEVYVITDEAGCVTSVNGIQPDSSGNVTISIPSAVTESTVAGWGFTKNVGTVTSVNGVSPTNGNVAIPIPTVNNGTLTITQDGNTLGTFGANQSTNSTIDIPVPDLNGKADIDGSNINQLFSTNLVANMSDTANIYMSGMGMPSDTYIDLTLGASGSTYTAPANGYIFLNKSSSGAGQYTGITNNTSGLITEQISTANYQNLPCSLECGQGDSLTVEYTAGGALISFRFVYAQGSESEAN